MLEKQNIGGDNVCIIAICLKRKMTINEIKNAHCINSDGIGFAFQLKEKIFYKKGLDINELIRLYNSIPVPHIIHFRLTSVGQKSKYLTHPFEISTKSTNLTTNLTKNNVLFHNGTINHYNLSKKINVEITNENDTSILAKYLAQFDTKTQIAILETLSLTTYNKFALLTPKNIHYFGDFIEYKGILFSNYSFSNNTNLNPSCFLP